MIAKKSTEIDAIAEIAALTVELRTVNESLEKRASLPVALASMQGTLDDALNDVRSNLPAELGSLRSMLNPEERRTAILDRIFYPGPNSGHDLASLFRLSIVTNPSFAKIIIDLIAQGRPGAGISDAQRASDDANDCARVKDLQRKIEEVICREEARGLRILRQGDAPPEIVAEYDAKTGKYNEAKIHRLLRESKEKQHLRATIRHEIEEVRLRLHQLNQELDQAREFRRRTRDSDVEQLKRYDSKISGLEESKKSLETTAAELAQEFETTNGEVKVLTQVSSNINSFFVEQRIASGWRAAPGLPSWKADQFRMA